MRSLEFGKEASLASVIEAVKAVPDKEISLKISPETPWLKNPVNEKILRKSLQQFGKEVHFEGRPNPEVAPIEIPESPVPEVLPTPARKISQDEAGFVVGGDIMAEPEGEAAPPMAEAPLIAKPAENKEKISPDRLANTKRVLKRVFGRWPVVIISVIGLILLAGAYVVYALPKADVNIIVEQRPLEREATLTASVTADKVDVDARKIPARVQTSTQSGTKKADATGKKTVGTSAKGTVTIYNDTDFDKTFPAGQKITSKSNTALKFSFDTTVMVPKRTLNTDTLDPFDHKSGFKEVAVTAVAIGTDYNLGANSQFSVDGPYTDFIGINSVALSGGSSKDVKVASQIDLDKLLTDLTKELTDKAKADIESKGGSDEKVIDNGIRTEVVSKSYDKKAGDEATDVTLNLTLKATATTYSAQNLKDILGQTLKQAAPEGYEIAEEGQQTSAEIVQVEDNGDLTFVGRIRANLIPSFDRDKLARDLAGKQPQAAETYLKAIASVVKYELNIWPNLPSFIQAFPRDSKRIHIQVKVQ
jgi:hypothetical protein